MLFIMNLDWSRFAISDIVVEANNYLEKLARELNADQKIIFNCASLGTGERLLPFDKGAFGTNDMPDDDTLEYIRWHHQQVRGAIAQSEKFQSNRDVTEMLDRLKRSGHEIVAVYETSTCNLEESLRDSRVRDYFEDGVFGYDRRSQRLMGDVTLASLFATAVEMNDVDYGDTMVVADNAAAIEDAAALRPCAVIGYLDPYVPWDEQTQRLKEMDAAGSNFSVVGGHYVAAIPHLVRGQADRIANAMLDGVMHRALGH